MLICVDTSYQNSENDYDYVCIPSDVDDTCILPSSSFRDELATACTRFSWVKTLLAGLHVPKKRFFFAVLFERFIFFFLLTQAEKKGFQPVNSPYFCLGQQKKNRSKRTAILGRVYLHVF